MVFGKQFQDILNAKYRGKNPGGLIEQLTGPFKGLAKTLLPQAYDIEQTDNIVSVDTPYQLDLGFGIPFTYIPDLLTQQRLIENKVSGGYYDNSALIRKEKQMTLYYIGVRKMFGEDPKLYYQVFNTKKKKAVMLATERNHDDIEVFMEWTESLLWRIERCFQTDNWFEGLHSYMPCGFPNTCPIYMAPSPKKK